MPEALRIAMVGAGGIAQAYLAAVESCPLAHLVAICDPRSSAASAAAERANCATYEAYQDIGEETPCDAVVICTPPSTHADIALHFLKRGVPVLCEKPLSIDLPSARAMTQAAAANHVPLAMASKFRYVEDVIETKSIIESGSIGDVFLIENTFAATVDMSNRWNSDPKVSGGGVLIDNGTHSVDIVRYLLGPIVDVLTVSQRNLQGIPVEDSATLHLHTASRADGVIDLSWSLHKDQRSFVRVYGTNGLVEVGWQRSRYKLSSNPDWTEFGHGYQKNEAFLRKLTNFCECVLGRADLLISAEDALASVEVIQAAYSSMKTGRWTSVVSTEPSVAMVSGR